MDSTEARLKLRQIIEEAVSLQRIIEQEQRTPAAVIFWQILEGMEIRLDFTEYPNRLFGFKGHIFLCEYDFIGKILWFSYDRLWRVFEREYNMSYNEIAGFIVEQIETNFKLKITARWRSPLFSAKIEKHFRKKTEDYSFINVILSFY